MEPDVVRELATGLLEAHRSGKPVPSIAARYDGFDSAAAYDVQREQVRLRTASGEVVRGFKVGLGPVPAQRAAGLSGPVSGHLTDRMITTADEPVSAASFLRPRVEPALALVLGRSLRGPGVTSVEAMRAVDLVVPAAEVVDSRIEDGSATVADAVADNASCGALLAGSSARALREVDLRLAGCLLHRNGELAATGAGGAVLGSPVNALVWLANAAGHRGTVLEAGHVVVVSSITSAVPVVAGDTVTVGIAGLGGVTVVVAP